MVVPGTGVGRVQWVPGGVRGAGGTVGAIPQVGYCPAMGKHIVVVGIGADGWDGLDRRRRDAVKGADVVLGGERHLELLPELVKGQRIAWPSPLREGLPDLLDSIEGEVVALGSGDPMLAGIGSTLVDLLGPEAVTVLPGISSVSLALARMRWAGDDVMVVRDHQRLLRQLREGQRAVVLSADGSTPAVLAAELSRAGFGASTMSVHAELGGAQEAVRHGLAASWGDDASPQLNLVTVEVHSSGGHTLPAVPGLPDDAFEHDGQITKRDVRASALARLAPDDGLLWDVGSGAGSVAIEWSRHAPSTRAIAVESRPERAERIARNADSLGVPDVEVVVGRAPDALESLETPVAVFVGGGATDPGLLSTCWRALRPGGRIVVHGVTLETERLLAEWFTRHGGELTRLHVEHVEPIGRFTGWTPARAITQWAATKPEDDAVPVAADGVDGEAGASVPEPEPASARGSGPGAGEAGPEGVGEPPSTSGRTSEGSDAGDASDGGPDHRA